MQVVTFTGDEDVALAVPAITGGQAVLFWVRDVSQLQRCLRLLLAEVTYTAAKGARPSGSTRRGVGIAVQSTRAGHSRSTLRQIRGIVAGIKGNADGTHSSRVWVAVIAAQLALPDDIAARVAAFDFKPEHQGEALQSHTLTQSPALMALRLHATSSNQLRSRPMVRDDRLSWQVRQRILQSCSWRWTRLYLRLAARPLWPLSRRRRRRRAVLRPQCCRW